VIVVADTSPLVVLANIGQLDVLPSLFGNILITAEVFAELNSPQRPRIVREWSASLPPWIRVEVPESHEPIDGLHAGESSAIALALERNADRLIIDEARGRRAATERGIPVVGTIGVLVAAAQAGLVDLEVAFERIKQTDFWVSEKFLDERLAMFRAWQRNRLADETE
jgi:predicted nucleic acid-binding protein